ncbi:MAG: hypothetical protein H0T53_05255 [Herpetosiphonaceae bacterium]|nr:hypothetical protein [Herpetosiphonaceae bacterium]
MSDGYFVLPMRLILPAEQRERLERLCRGRQQEISDVVSEIVSAYIEELPDDQLADPRPEVQGPSVAEQIRQHERELRRLRMRQTQLGAAAPAWLANYVADIERELEILRDPLGGEA